MSQARRVADRAAPEAALAVTLSRRARHLQGWRHVQVDPRTWPRPMRRDTSRARFLRRGTRTVSLLAATVEEHRGRRWKQARSGRAEGPLWRAGSRLTR